MNKAIVIIQLYGSMGGAQKRYINLFNYINKYHKDYILIINQNLYNNFYSEDYANSSEKNKRIYVLDIDKYYRQKTTQTSTSHIANPVFQENKRLNFVKRIKHLLFMIFLWISFLKKTIPILHRNKISYIYTIWLGGIWLWPVKYFMKFKLVYGYMDSGYSSLSKSIPNILNSERWVLKRADVIDFLSYDLYKYIIKDVKPQKSVKYSITPNSFIDYSNYYPEYPKENLIVFLARLEKIKNPILLLEAIQIANYKLVDYRIKIIGEGPLEESVKSFIIRNKLNNVFFMGKTYRPWEYLRKSKIFISIQENNNYPSQSLLEAMACENAIIASDVGETRKLISENEGILVSLDKISVSNAIIYLVENQEICYKLGKNARRTAIINHSMEKFIKYFYSLEDL